ncbi:hypothetical protein [Haloferax sulfurifontis]|uniref:Uncharacterized protein n=1 Tax=Haloferax sulfurifontis TaxID=255616 RepID=A0A830E725_9EURY|nr:hypothetical protein [Haloferax sulfurifontis]GGC48389.1 hypothetical protein GCM10007209_07520 [Haloferax sulfurifontis]
MDNDDEPVGRLLTRRQALAVGGTAAAAWLAGCTTGGDADAADTSNATSTETTASPAMSTDSPVRR